MKKKILKNHFNLLEKHGKLRKKNNNRVKPNKDKKIYFYIDANEIRKKIKLLCFWLI